LRGDGVSASKKKPGYSKLGKTIKKKLIDKNMTAKELADALGTTPQYLNKILHGERSGEKYIQAIKKILDIAA
jgi:transcriptional regulator with XRE-family HTH domain